MSASRSRRGTHGRYTEPAAWIGRVRPPAAEFAHHIASTRTRTARWFGRLGFGIGLALLLLLAQGAAPVAATATADVPERIPALDVSPAAIDAPDVVVRYVDASATGSNDGSSWANAYTNLSLALAFSSFGTQLWIAEGTYLPTAGTDRSQSFTLRDGVSLYGGFPQGGGDGTFAARIPATYPTILSGDIGVQGDVSDNSAHVLRGGSSIGREIVVDGVVIAGGNANADAPHNRGGGLYLTGGVVTLRNCIIRDNRAEGGAPAVFASDGATLTIDGCVIESNSTPGEGSAVQIDDGIDTLIDGTIIRNNAAAFGIGPVRLVRGNSTVRNTVLVNNTNAAPSSGVLTIQGGQSTIEHVSISGHNQSALALINAGASGSTVTLANSVLWGNGANAIFLTAESSLTVDSSVVEGGFAGGTNVLTGDPAFLDAVGGDLRLGTFSPAKDAAASATCAKVDVQGFPRPLIQGCDMGAYEMPTRYEVCRAPNAAIPDFDPEGITDSLVIDGRGTILDVDVTLKAPHESVNDLVVTLTHEQSGIAQTLMSAPGRTEFSPGCNKPDVDVIFDDAGTAQVQDTCDPTSPAISGRLRPFQPLATFNGAPLDNGSVWSLKISDVGGFLTGTLDAWCVSVAVLDGYTVTRTDDPAPDGCKVDDCSLREAILAANANAGWPESIHFALDGDFRIGRAGTGEDLAATGDLDITDDLTIVGNNPERTIIDGAGFDRVFHVRDGASATLTDLTIQNGSYDPVDENYGGGGIAMEGGGTLLLQRTVLRNNRARATGTGFGFGGAVFVADSKARIETGAIYENQADQGGALDSINSSVDLVNATVSSNSTAGGALSVGALSGGTAQLSLLNTTVAENPGIVESPAGPAIVSFGYDVDSTATVRLQNSIVSGESNLCATFTNGGGSAAFVSLDNNIASDDTCNLTGALDLPNTDPRLAPATDNGGATTTMALLPNSPALDAGADAACPATDQRGLSRIDRDGNGDGGNDGNWCDIGAYEAQARPNTPPVANAQTVSAQQGVARNIVLTGSDADGDTLTYSIIVAPEHGTLTGDAPNLVYTANSTYVGPDAITFSAGDGATFSEPAVVTINVTQTPPPNTPPVANDQTVQVAAGGTVAITLRGSDADGDPLTYGISVPPTRGALSGTAPDLIYTPNLETLGGTDVFTFFVNDGQETAVGTITINIGQPGPPQNNIYLPLAR